MNENNNAGTSRVKFARVLRELDLLTVHGDSDDSELVLTIELAAARVMLREGDLDGARAILGSVAPRAAGSALAQPVAEELIKLARHYQQHAVGDQIGPCEDCLRTAVELAPELALVPLAQFLQKQGKTAEAIAAWREAAKINTRDATAHLALARLYRKSGEPQKALEACLQLVASAATARNVLQAAQILDQLRSSLPRPNPGQGIKIALLGNATLDHIKSYLLVQCYEAGLRPEIYVGGFDQYTQEVLDPGSGLYNFAPDLLVLAIHPARLFPNLHKYPFDLSVAERRAEMDRGLEQIENLLTTFSQRSSALVLIHNMPVPQYPVLGILDLRDELGQTAAFGEINVRLADLVRNRFRNVYVVDEERVQARAGKSTATDPRMWFSARLPWSESVLWSLAHEYLRVIRPLKGLTRKCIVLDLDNTLWGGVIGEDGPAGIKLGTEAPGNAYVAFQLELEKLWRRGILLAVCSKNNPEDVAPVFEQHPDMVLKMSHFAAHRINWEQKSTNIREIARELNIGLDSLVFLDDNPVERARVRAELPQVLVPELPADPALYRTALLQLGVFDSLALTEEDRSRNRLYMEQKARQEYEAKLDNGTSLDDYLSGLHMIVDVAPSSSLTLPRIAQLTNKTNQFNLTTHRYTEAQIIEMQSNGSEVFSMSVMDRFGDNGLVAVAILSPVTTETWEVDTFLMSCRVMGRGVETALLASMIELLRDRGIRQLQGWYLPTTKNAPVKDFYRQHGFRLINTRPDGGELWTLSVEDAQIQPPAWLTVRTGSLQGAS